MSWYLQLTLNWLWIASETDSLTDGIGVVWGQGTYRQKLTTVESRWAYECSLYHSFNFSLYLKFSWSFLGGNFIRLGEGLLRRSESPLVNGASRGWGDPSNNAKVLRGKLWGTSWPRTRTLEVHGCQGRTGKSKRIKVTRYGEWGRRRAIGIYLRMSLDKEITYSTYWFSCCLRHLKLKRAKIAMWASGIQLATWAGFPKAKIVPGLRVRFSGLRIQKWKHLSAPCVPRSC